MKTSLAGKSTKAKFLTIAALSTVGIVLSGSPALAVSKSADSLDILDASSLISAVAPETLNDSTDSASAPLRISAFGAEAGLDVTIDPEKNATRDTANKLSADASMSPALQIEADFTTKLSSNTSDLKVWETSSDSSAAYMQPMSSGVRLFTAIEDDTAPTTYDYRLDVPDGSTLRKNSLGYMILSPTGHSLGQISTVFARDSAGSAIPSHLTLSDNTLTQTIDTSAQGEEITYPVLASTAWSYTFTRTIRYVPPLAVYTKLLDCFNCYFPVAGAPTDFPSYNEFLPLTVAGMNFNCYRDAMHYQTQENLSWFGYSFRATSDHVDGLGSMISFDFNPTWAVDDPDTIHSQMVVSAYIMNANPGGFPQSVYTYGAKVEWDKFGFNLESS